jgi:serine/threonine protein kinase
MQTSANATSLELIVPRSRRSVRFAQDIAATTTARTFTAARTLCKGLEGEEPRVVTSNSAGYVVTTSTKISPSTSEETFVSLESILTERPSRTVHSQRLKIAHAIASSHLRLHPTQWLGDRWSSRDIVFAVKDGLPLLEQPYLRRQSLRGSTGPTEIVRWDDATSTLGILLLELCFNQTIASFARDRQYAQALCALHEEIALAKQWYRELSGRTDDDYDDAVAWCLSTFTQIRDINSEWRQSMQDRVIKPLEKLCNNSVSTSLKVDFDKAAWALRNKFGRLFVVCKKVDDDPSRKGDDDDPIYQTLALEKAYCPDDALENLVRQESTLLKDVYTASRLCCLSVKNHVDIRAFRMDKTDIYNEADEFYLGISRQTIYQKICGTFILAMTNPPSETWFKAWDRFTACCRGGQPHLSELITTYFPLDEDVIERLFTGHNPAERKLSPIDPESADVSAFGSSQYYFCAARLVVHKQLHDHSMNDKHSLRMPFTSIKRIGSGSSAAVYRVAIHGGHYDGPDRELAMKVLNVGPKTADEWRHTAWMMDQLQTHECIMRARASLRIHRQVMIFYEAAECDLYSYMTNEEPPSWISRIRMFYTIRDIAHALNYLHSGLSHEAAAMACLHKDMKAENLLVTWRPDKQMRLKLADFGISSIIHERSLPKGDDSNGPSRHMPREHKTRTELSENLHNAAPEMHDNGLVDASADIWAFGTVLADYIAWLFSGRDGLQGFECAKSMGYTDHAYFCVSRSQKEQNDSLPKKNAPGELAQFVLKKEIGDWFESAIHRVRKDKLVAEADVKMLEDCWWLLKSHILVCDARKRANSEDVLRWMGEIYKGTFVRSTNTKNSSKSPKESATQFGQGSVPITTSSTKRERTLSSPTASHKKMRCMHEMMTVES